MAELDIAEQALARDAWIAATIQSSTYTWKVHSYSMYKQEYGGLEDIVFGINLRLIAVNVAEGLYNVVEVATGIGVPDEASYIPSAQLTEATILEWALQSLSEEAVLEAKTKAIRTWSPNISIKSF
jgi:hypothetical protein